MSAALASVTQLADSTQSPEFTRIFKLLRGSARAHVGDKLHRKYDVPTDNEQDVISITNMVTYEQVHYNTERARKPQTFPTDNHFKDPTLGKTCDFCDWQHFTAADVFGRIEREHAVTASNLFKYGEPFHGLALFKHHDPLHWNVEQLRDLLAVSAEWYSKAQQTYSDHSQTDDSTPSSSSNGHEAARPWNPRTDRQLYKFFIWNCLPRAGASQFHGHAQLMATRVPVPSQALLNAQSIAYSSTYPGQDYAKDLLRAHRSAGLLRACAASPEDAQACCSGRSVPRAWVAACLTPIKDMELLVAVEVPLSTSDQSASGLTCPAFALGLHVSLRAIIDCFGMDSFNVGMLSLQSTPSNAEQQGSSMLVARIVSRGHSSKVASDFGCLEVVGRASIGNTDPYLVIEAVDKQLAEIGVGVPLELAGLD